MANHILTIPAELLIKILSYLDAVSLTRCTMTCTLICETLKSSSILSYILQLHFNGVCNPDIFTTQSYSELVQHLVQRRQAQMFPKWTVNATFQMRCSCIALDLANGVFISTDTLNLELGLLPTADSATSFGVLSSRFKSGISVHNLAIDMTQSMMVLMEDDDTHLSMTDTRTIRVHIRTITDSDPHPLAQQSPLLFTVAPDEAGNSADNSLIQIAGNTLMLYFSTAEYVGQIQPRVLIWDWMTSDLILDSSTSSPPLLPSFESEIALLDSTYFFVTCVSGSGSIKLYSLAPSSVPNTPAIHLATLHLPPTDPRVTICRIATHAGPIEASPLFHTPFAVHDDDRLHTFTIMYNRHDPAESLARQLKIDHLNLFTHQRVFTKYCAQGVRSQDRPLDIPWEAWGPYNTKIIYPSRIHGEYYKKNVHGQRVVLQASPNYKRGLYDHGTNFVEVLDFSLAAMLSVQGVLPTPQPSSERSFPGKLLSSSKIDALQRILFTDDVETHLPCVSFTADLERSYSRFMIYADGVIGLNKDPHMFIASLDVYTI